MGMKITKGLIKALNKEADKCLFYVKEAEKNTEKSVIETIEYINSIETELISVYRFVAENYESKEGQEFKESFDTIKEINKILVKTKEKAKSEGWEYKLPGIWEKLSK